MFLNATVFKAGKLFDLRPIDMWMGEVSKNGKLIPRFQKISDPAIIAELEKIKIKMYGDQAYGIRKKYFLNNLIGNSINNKNAVSDFSHPS